MESQRSTRLPPVGLPILSGPPPITESSTCRQCSKEFNLLWRRKHACGHCGYEYCSNCLSDGQALMPRRPGQSSSSSQNQSGPASFLADIKEGLGIDDKKEGSSSGYEVESVCLFCLGMLQVTAASLPQLRSLPIKRLKEYLAAYNIPCVGPKEKEDFVQAIVRARNSATGCLHPENESYFRRRSVPKLGQPPSASSSTSSTPRPRPPPPTQARPPPPSTGTFNNARPPPPSTNYARPPPPSYVRPQASAPSRARPPQPAARPPPPRSNPISAPRASPAPAPQRQPSPPVPTILSLVSLPKSYLASLSIGTLKAILYENHVRVDFKQVLEKDQLIDRVNELVVDERKRLERQRIEEERQANGEALELEQSKQNGDQANGVNGEVGEEGEKKPAPTGPMPEIDRGLCVVCQDEEATLAVVDCGHLCMCPHCSDLIMATSQECPLCRTRIVTSQRLIRIYRT